MEQDDDDEDAYIRVQKPFKRREKVEKNSRRNLDRKAPRFFHHQDHVVHFMHNKAH